MGKEQILEMAWREYSDKLLSYILNKINSTEDAEDVLAEVFLKLAKQTELTRIPHKLPNWLYRTTRNSIIDYYRTKKPFDPLPDNLIQNTPSVETMAVLSRCLMPIIDELPQLYRLPIIKSEIEEKTMKQVSEELGLSLPAVKSRILRGRKKLKQAMSRRCTFYYDEEGQLTDYKEKTQ